MKDNTAQEPQTIWWNDSAYIILWIFQRSEILSKAAVYLYFFFFLPFGIFFNEEVGVEAEENISALQLRESLGYLCRFVFLDFVFFFSLRTHLLLSRVTSCSFAATEPFISQLALSPSALR